jgi:tetratricopeptide (TPR) repeat protein
MVRQGLLNPRDRLLAAAAAALVPAVYAGSIQAPFVYDDYDTIVANPSLRESSSLSFVLAYSLFRPVVNLSYAVDFRLWGLEPSGYHVTNIALHALNVVLLYLVAHAAVRDWRARSSEVDAVSAPFVAFFAAGLFAVHPMMAEGVAYVSGRSEVLCGAGFLAAWLALRRWMIEGGAGWLAGGLGAFALALGSKEIAAMFPFVLLAYDRVLGPGHDADRAMRLRRLHLPLVALVLALAAVRLATLAWAETPIARAPWQNVLTQAIVVLRYTRLLVVPVGQSAMHGVWYVTSWFDLRALVAVSLLAGAVIAAWRLRHRQPLWTVGALWFLLVLLPSSSVVALREGMAEHRAYLASCGLFLGAAAALESVVAAGRPRAWAWARWPAVAVLAILAALTVGRTRVWADPVRLWGEAVERAPGMWEPRYLLADTLRERRRCAEAVPEYEAVLRLRPAHRDAYNNLGICLGELRQLDAAEEAFRRALGIDPGFARARANLGMVAMLKGDDQEARRQFEQAAADDPRNVLARLQLARLFESTFPDPAAAARLCREVQALAPATPGIADCVRRNEERARQ